MWQKFLSNLQNSLQPVSKSERTLNTLFPRGAKLVFFWPRAPKGVVVLRQHCRIKGFWGKWLTGFFLNCHHLYYLISLNLWNSCCLIWQAIKWFEQGGFILWALFFYNCCQFKISWSLKFSKVNFFFDTMGKTWENLGKALVKRTWMSQMLK